MKKTTVHLCNWFYGWMTIGDKVTLSGRWKTVVTNDNYTLQFEDTEGNWWTDDILTIVTREEFINECSNS